MKSDAIWKWNEELRWNEVKKLRNEKLMWEMKSAAVGKGNEEVQRNANWKYKWMQYVY